MVIASLATPVYGGAFNSRQGEVGAFTRAGLCNHLESLYVELEPGIGCLRESPVVERNTCYTSTNLLAEYVLRNICGYRDLADRVRAFLEKYKPGFYDYYQVLLGERVVFPFNATRHEVVGLVQVGGGEVVIKRVVVASDTIVDYYEYANLVALKAVGHAERGELSEAREELSRLEALFDGRGFADKAFKARREELGESLYEAYKLALAVIAHRVAGEEDGAEKYASILQRIKPPATYYTPDLAGSGDLNVETACLAAIALYGQVKIPVAKRVGPPLMLVLAALFLVVALTAVSTTLWRGKKSAPRGRKTRLGSLLIVNRVEWNTATLLPARLPRA